MEVKLQILTQKIPSFFCLPQAISLAAKTIIIGEIQFHRRWCFCFSQKNIFHHLLIWKMKIYFFQHSQNQHFLLFFSNKSDSRAPKTEFDLYNDIHRMKAVDLPVILAYGLGVFIWNLWFFSMLRTEVSLFRWTASYLFAIVVFF